MSTREEALQTPSGTTSDADRDDAATDVRDEDTQAAVEQPADESVEAASQEPAADASDAPAPPAEPEAEAADEPEAAVAEREASEPPAAVEASVVEPEVQSVEAEAPAPAEVGDAAAPAASALDESAPAQTTAVIDPDASEDAVDEGEAEGDDEEDDEALEGAFFYAPGDWYVVHTYAGYENKVKANLASRIQSMNMEDKIFEVIVPTEEVMELKSGKMQAIHKKVFPGYILVRMDLDDDSWYVVRNTPGVTGFVGTGAKPTPLDPHEVQNILAPQTEERLRPRLEFEVGEVVSVVGGAFNGYSGPVNAIDVDKQRVTVLLDLFGRETPVELTFDQVQKL
jgi:transcription termination/antitermination protein NusG